MPTPLGARCRSPLGAFIRSPLGAFDCPGCPATLDVTFSGVTPCACRDIGGNSYLNVWKSDLNATHSVPIDVVEAECTYIDRPVAEITVERYTGSGCTGSPASTVDYEVSVTVVYDKDAGVVTSVEARVHLGGLNVGTAFTWSGSGALDTPLSNTNTCLPSSTFGQASSGTVTVSLP